MEREEAISRIRELIGQDLRPLADKYGITVWAPNGNKNKGWAGHVIERYLGLPLNSAQAPNFGSWELKIVPLKIKGGRIVVKETMAITMMDPHDVVQKPFEESHLLRKLKKMVVAARLFESQEERRSILLRVGTFDLGNESLAEQVRRDYVEVRSAIRENGFDSLSGSMGQLVQPRTKGPGHGSTSRAFYARTGFVATILALE
jgi:DNA mismatch repair protein MutH